MQTLGDLLINILATVIGIFVVYGLFMPRIRTGHHVRTRIAAEGHPVYNCSYRNAGLFKVHDVKVRANLRYLAGVSGERTWQLLPIPVDDYEVPVLGRRKGKKYQLPKLLLDRADWASLPAAKRPNGPVNLAAIMTALDAELYLHVACSSSISQVTKVFRRCYGPGDVQDPAAP